MPDGLVAHHTLTPEKSRQSRPAKIAQPERQRRHIPVNVPGFSIEQLGRQLALSGYREHLFDEAALAQGDREVVPGGGSVAANTAGRLVETARRATQEHNVALETLILNCRATTVSDVIVQLLVSSSHLTRAEGAENDLERSKYIDALRRVMSGAIRILGEVHAIPLADLGGNYWAAFVEDDWPDIDLGRVAVSGPPRSAIDGSVTEWER